MLLNKSVTLPGFTLLNPSDRYNFYHFFNDVEILLFL